MPNDYFQFKQFKINQARSGMKVTTEACLFAALIEGSKSQSILDIGSGTGLLGLMLAQRSTAEVSCVEIEPSASLDMEQNIKQSPWSNRINGYHEDIQDFLIRRCGLYDTIVSNPPFYQGYLPAEHPQRQQALHQSSLTYKILVKSVKAALSPSGMFWVIYPFYESQVFQSYAEELGVYRRTYINVYNKEGQKNVFRQISCFGKKSEECPVNEINIRNNKGDYSQDFIKLLKPYYLHL